MIFKQLRKKELERELTIEEIRSFIKPFDTNRMKARPIAKINPFMLQNYTTEDFMAYYYYPELADILSSDSFEKGGDLME